MGSMIDVKLSLVPPVPVTVTVPKSSNLPKMFWYTFTLSTLDSRISSVFLWMKPFFPMILRLVIANSVVSIITVV